MQMFYKTRYKDFANLDDGLQMTDISVSLSCINFMHFRKCTNKSEEMLPETRNL